MAEIAVLWACLAAFVVFYGVRGLRDVRNIFSPPLILSLLMTGILVKSYLDYDQSTLAAFLDHDYYVMTLFYTVLCLLAFCLLYERALRSAAPARRFQVLVDHLPSNLTSMYVTVIAIVGFSAQLIFTQQSGGLIEFYSQAHGSAGNYAGASAYFYALPNFLWPAMLISYVTWTKGGRTSLYLLLLLALIAAALFAHTFLFGNRNGVVRFCIMLGAAYVFIHRPSLMRATPLLGLLLAAVVTVLVIAQIRHHLHLGSDVSLAEALAEYFAERHQQRIRPEGAGHELFFNVAVVQAAFSTRTYDYGAQYIYPIINLIPRFVWPGKPYQMEFGVDFFALVEDVMGWSAGGGAAIGAIGQSFLAFSWFGAILWGIFGYYCGRAVKAAREAPTLMNLGVLISCLLATVYWGTQSFAAVFAAWFFTIAPFYGLVIVAALLRSTPRTRSRRATALRPIKNQN